MDNFLKEIYNLEEMIKGEINRMCVTYELSELDTMHLHAIRNVEKIWQMNYKRLKEKTFDGIPSAQPEQKWIPFTKRPLTEEERTENPYFDYILDCKLPDDGQRILMSINIKGHEQVQLDEYYCDNGESYLDGGYEIGTEAVAWMPLPEPYKEEQDGKA